MEEKKKWKIGVIGAGPGGLSAAYELHKTGRFDVTVFEASPQVGGRMSTRVKDGLAFDRGANFFVAGYTNTANYCRELGLENSWESVWKPGTGRGDHFTIRDGKLCRLTLNSLWSIFKFNALSFKSKLKLLRMFWNISRTFKNLNFFDLSSLPAKINTTNAYDYVAENVGVDAADYIVDAFSSMYDFHSAKEMSSATMFALINMMANNTGGFIRYHTAGDQMSTIPEAMAKRLNVKISCPINTVRYVGLQVIARTETDIHSFDKLVLATTADVARKIYKNPTIRQGIFMDSVKYASTINVSFKVPIGLLGNIACVAVPIRENSIICEYTNELPKGISSDGNTLINVGIHEDATKKLICESDEDVFSIVSKELIKVCPPLQNNPAIMKNHDLERWPSAMPKFSKEFVDSAREFWDSGQGGNNVYFAGDMTGCPWVEGAFTSGKKVASYIIDDIDHNDDRDIIFVR